MSNAPWYTLGITQAHGQNGELGVDVGTPFHTPITDVFGGKVIDAGYHPWGGQVDIATTLPSGQSVIEQFLHLDQIAAGIKAGWDVSAGQLIGLSGGQTSGGAHPVQNRPDFTYSTGPHTEFGLYTGTPGPSTALDPTGYLADGSVGVGSSGSGNVPWWQQILLGLGVDAITSNPLSLGAAELGTQTGYTAGTDIKKAIPDIPAAIGHAVANAGLILLALVLVMFGLALLLWPSQEKIEQGAASAAKVAEVAAA